MAWMPGTRFMRGPAAGRTRVPGKPNRGPERETKENLEIKEKIERLVLPVYLGDRVPGRNVGYARPRPGSLWLKWKPI